MKNNMAISPEAKILLSQMLSEVMMDDFQIQLVYGPEEYRRTAIFSKQDSLTILGLILKNSQE